MGMYFEIYLFIFSGHFDLEKILHNELLFWQIGIGKLNHSNIHMDFLKVAHFGLSK